jgi:hypothetical protein
MSHEKLPTDEKVLSHLEFKLKVLPRSLNDFSACVGFCASTQRRVSNFNCDVLICFGGTL